VLPFSGTRSSAKSLDELLVRVHAAGLNPVDYKTRAGTLRIIHKCPLPIVMGNELSGIVEAVGLALQLPFRFEVRALSDRLVSSAPE
jgi:NADPH:quinone reductase-like Zn-dependent oxidoreductase